MISESVLIILLLSLIFAWSTIYLIVSNIQYFFHLFLSGEVQCDLGSKELSPHRPGGEDPEDQTCGSVRHPDRQPQVKVPVWLWIRQKYSEWALDVILILQIKNVWSFTDVCGPLKCLFDRPKHAARIISFIEQLAFEITRS